MTKDAASLFSKQQIDSRSTPGWKSREKMICMRIDDFLSMAKPGHQQEKLDRIEAAIERKQALTDIPFLIAYTVDDEYTMQVVGHEGRHRAKALKAMGLQTMPVVITCDIRWSEQEDPERFDYRPIWPESLVSECGSTTIPFPISRENAMTPYDGEPFKATNESDAQAAKKTHLPGM